MQAEGNQEGEHDEHAGKWADHVNEAYYDQMGEEFGSRTRERIHWICSEARGNRVLDVGCSQGITSLLLAREGFQVLGVDLLPGAIEYALAERMKEPSSVARRVTFVCCDLASIDAHDFDTVLLGEVLEHQTSPARLIDEAIKRLAEGGRLVITTPFGLHPHADHKSMLFPRGLSQLLASMKIETVDVTGGYMRVVASKQAVVADQDLPGLLCEATEAGALAAQQRFYEVLEAYSSQSEKLSQADDGIARMRSERDELYERLLTEHSRISSVEQALLQTKHRLELNQLSREREEADLEKQFVSLKSELSVAQSKRHGHYEQLKAERQRTAEIIGIAQRLHEENQRYQTSLALALGRALLGLSTIKGFIGFPFVLLRAFAAYRQRRRGASPDVPLYLPPVASISSPRRERAPEEKKLSIIGWTQELDERKVTLMSVMDEFSRSCFAPHANLVEPRPDNWAGLLDEYHPAFLLVESSWRGNYGSWQYRVANYAHPPGRELQEMVAGCRAAGVPTVFWNKEDPVHFENFIEVTKSFDHILTTASEAVPLYQEKTSADVGVLMFAAEESIHNPIGSAIRNDRVCFAGSFYANRFADRRQDQLMLLHAASSFNLDIYDRNYDPASGGSGDFGFPAELVPFVRGALPYAEMSSAYRRYRVFLNVNSVIDSPTMFSRRVFELLACGTPVVSTWSRGTEEVFGDDIVWHVRSQREVTEALEVLMTDDREWKRRSLAGIRLVLSKHTSRHRFGQILERLGISPAVPPASSRPLIVASAATQEEAHSIIAAADRQVLVDGARPKVLLSARQGFDLPETGLEIELVHGGERPLAELAIDMVKQEGLDLLAPMRPDCLYGKYHLLDLSLALKYSHSPIVGRPHESSAQYQHDVPLLAGSLLMSFESARRHGVGLADILVSGSASNESGGKCYAADNANFLALASVDAGEHQSRLMDIEV